MNIFTQKIDLVELFLPGETSYLERYRNISTTPQKGGISALIEGDLTIEDSGQYICRYKRLGINIISGCIFTKSVYQFTDLPLKTPVKYVALANCHDPSGVAYVIEKIKNKNQIYKIVHTQKAVLPLSEANILQPLTSTIDAEKIF